MSFFKNWFYIFFRKIGFICSCGSSSHPRKCKKHPWYFRQHVLDINHDNLHFWLEELEERVEKLERGIREK